MSDRVSILKRFEAFLEEEEKVSAPGVSTEAAREAQVAFWREMRRVLAVNAASKGLDILDEGALAFIDSTGSAPSNLTRPVLVLPAPAKQIDGDGASAHAVFDEEPESKKRGIVKASSAQPQVKKQKKSSAKSDTPQRKSPANSDKSQKDKPDFKLPLEVPPAVRAAIEGMFSDASRVDKWPYQVAYPWVGQVLWYEPARYPHVHLAHWRFWMACRRVFFEWALHAPLATSSAQTQRRKRKMAAMRERLKFPSLCIESWGYFGLLRRLEGAGNGNLMWWGGQTGRNTAEAKGYLETCIPVHDLLDLYERNGPEFRRKLRGALKPFKLDEGSFETLPKLLEKTGALDPDAVEFSKRLSDRALARIALDMQSTEPTPDHWVPTKTEGDWRLNESSRIRDLRIKIKSQLESGKYQIPRVKPYDPSESEGRGFEPFCHADGSPTAVGPVTPYEPPVVPPRETEIEEEEKHESEEESKLSSPASYQVRQSSSDEDSE